MHGFKFLHVCTCNYWFVKRLQGNALLGKPQFISKKLEMVMFIAKIESTGFTKSCPLV